MNPATALARVVIDELARNGVPDVVLAPGSRSAPLAMAAAAADGAGLLRLHVRHDERSAAFAALGIAMSVGRPSAVVTTSGTAVANLHPAVLEAHHSGVPLVLLTADRPEELRGVGANQTTDQTHMFGGSVRLFMQIDTADERPGQVAYWRSSISRACHAASGVLSGDPGPVHLNVGFRAPLVPAGDEPWPEPLDGRPGRLPWSAATASTSPAGLASLGNEPETLMVLGDVNPAAADAAWRLAQSMGWPVIAEPRWRAGGPAIPCGPLVVGSTRWLAGHTPERVLVVGRPTLSRQVAQLVGGSVAPVDVVASGPRWYDAAHAARRLYPAADLASHVAVPPSAGEWLSAWTSAGERARRTVDRVLDESLAAATPSGIAAARAALRAIPPAAVLVLGSSSVIRDVDLLAERIPARVLTNRGVGGIDGTVSTAVGAALAQPRADLPAYAIMGDLTFLHDSNGLVIGPEEPRPDLCLVVLNDDGGGIFALLEQGEPPHAGVFERVFGTPHGVDIEALCAATHTPYQRVEVEKLDVALTPQQGLRVVEIRVDRHHHRDLHARLRQEVAAALAES